MCAVGVYCRCGSHAEGVESIQWVCPVCGGMHNLLM